MGKEHCGTEFNFSVASRFAGEYRISGIGNRKKQAIAVRKNDDLRAGVGQARRGPQRS
jgi:hypothetical protein